MEGDNWSLQRVQIHFFDAMENQLYEKLAFNSLDSSCYSGYTCVETKRVVALYQFLQKLADALVAVEIH